jgi:hypothetical protein
MIQNATKNTAATIHNLRLFRILSSWYDADPVVVVAAPPPPPIALDIG